MINYCFGASSFIKALEEASAGDVVVLASRHTLKWGLPREDETKKQRADRIEDAAMMLRVMKK